MNGVSATMDIKRNIYISIELAQTASNDTRTQCATERLRDEIVALLSFGYCSLSLGHFVPLFHYVCSVVDGIHQNK